MIKFLKSYKDYVIILIGSNLTGILNLIQALIVLHISTENTYNIYTAYTSFFLVLTAQNKIVKNLSTTYGRDFVEFISSFVKRYLFQVSIVITTLILLITGVVSYLAKGGIVASVLLSIGIFAQLVFLMYTGLLQNRQEFSKSSIYIFLQNLLKFILGVLLFIFFGNIGIWFALSLTLIYFSFLLIKENSKRDKVKMEVKPSFSINSYDILLNILILVLVEIIFNIDSILVLNSLSTTDAHTYNSLILIKKSIFFSTLGFGQILLSRVKDKSSKGINLLIKNLIITLIVGASLGLFMYLAHAPILYFIDLDSSTLGIYSKFIVSTVLFSIFLIVTYWFTSYEDIIKRLIIIIAMICFILFYSLNINNLNSILNTFILGIICLIIIESILISTVKSDFSIQNRQIDLD